MNSPDFNARDATIALLRLWNEIATMAEFLPEPSRLAAKIHPEFQLTYNGQVILRGLADLRLHFRDVGAQLGPWKIPLPPVWTVSEGDRCVVLYDVVTERSGATRCCVLYSFEDGLCCGQDEFVTLPSNLDLGRIIRTD
jgi:SnoaL-like domain